MSIDNIKKLIKQINFRQPKYMLPAILYVPILFTGYFVIGIFTTGKAEVPDTSKQTTNYINDKLPDSYYKGDGIGSKYESMRNSYGVITDESAVNIIERSNEEEKEEFESQYSEEELAAIEAQRLAEQAEQSKATEATDAQKAREQEALKELERVLAEARLKGQMQASLSSEDNSENDDDKPDIELKGKININENAKSVPSSSAADNEVVKKVKVSSDYFNTLAVNEREPNMIKAIIDENIKAVDGSRVRLRLLDDVEIGDAVVPKGSYLYATMSGFGGQRVKGNVKSVMVGDEIIKINLALYDADGLEGLYVPESSFRETTQDVASGALSNNISMSTSSDNSLSQWGLQAAQNAYQKTSNAISKAIKKNRAKLKYGTFVYLINNKDTKTK